MKRLLSSLILSLTVACSVSAQVRQPIGGVPFTITKPGNYYLFRNVSLTKAGSAADSDGIRIDADNVTLDLNGREISTTLADGGTGISTIKAHRNVRVFNGSVRGFSVGVYLFGDGSFDVERVNVSNSKFIGIWVSGDYSSVRQCRVLNTNGGSVTNKLLQGIRMDKSYGLVEECLVEGLTRSNATYTVTGIHSTFQNNIRNNLIISSATVGPLLFGITSGGNGLISGNQVTGFATGMSLLNDVFRENTAFNCATNYTGGTDGGWNK